jgi:hypothetical protein
MVQRSRGRGACGRHTLRGKHGVYASRCVFLASAPRAAQRALVLQDEMMHIGFFGHPGLHLSGAHTRHTSIERSQLQSTAGNRGEEAESRRADNFDKWIDCCTHCTRERRAPASATECAQLPCALSSTNREDRLVESAAQRSKLHSRVRQSARSRRNRRDAFARSPWHKESAKNNSQRRAKRRK